MKFGVRRGKHEIPRVQFEAMTCHRCGSGIWVPVGLEGDPLCLDHSIVSQPDRGSYEFNLQLEANILKQIIRKSGNKLRE